MRSLGSSRRRLPPPKRRTIERYGIPLALVLASVSIALLGSEVALRVLGWFPPPERPPHNRRPDLYTSDPYVGYRLHAFLDTTYVYPPGRADPIPLAANSDGFRYAREFGSDDDRPTVLVVGDSFVFGEGVRAEERLTEVLESLEPDWRVDNLGMTGWGVDLMVRAMERFLPRVRPKVVVLCVYTDDFRRLLPYYAGVGVTYAKFELLRGGLVSVPNEDPGFIERSRLVQAWLKWRWSQHRNRYDLNEALLNRYLELSREYDFEPMTVFIPGRADTAEDQERRGFLEAWAERNGVPYLDLTEPIHSAGVRRVYITRNWHWNPKGHRIASEEIHRALITAGLMKASRM